MSWMCPCGKVAVERTAWTDQNAGKRFFGCAFGRGGCGFFMWIDPPLGHRSTEVIVGLLRRINRMEERHAIDVAALKKAEAEVKKKGCIPRYLVLIIVVVLLLMYVGA